MMTQYVYMAFDDMSELPVLVDCSTMPPEEYVTTLNRRTINTPMPNMDTVTIRLVAQFDNDVGKNCPFEKIGDFKFAISALETKKDLIHARK